MEVERDIAGGGAIAGDDEAGGIAGGDTGLIEEIIEDADIFVDWFVWAIGLGFGANFDAAGDETIVLDEHVADGSGFKPAIGIVFDEDGGHGAAVEGAVFDDDFAAGGEEESASGGHGDMAIAGGDMGVPGDVVDHVVVLELGGWSIEGE